jgi:GNAT superfamily N-acetyltransferase
MIFEILNKSAQDGNLILVDGGLCHWYLRRDKQITIREIIVLPEYQRQGIGTAILEQLKSVPEAKSIFAKCPVELPASEWYKNRGFTCEGEETTKGGRKLKLWRFQL